MVNHLINENSSYLLQHANNPVDWYPWGEISLQKSIDEDKPIFLSIGYSSCHWCHVMAHELFEDPAIAQILNNYFINIKVDREERPDIDSIYMNAVVALVGHGGWPLSIFLTPARKPFFGGTYFPPMKKYNMPSFKDVLLSIIRVWKEDRSGINDSSDRITQYLSSIQTSPLTYQDEIKSGLMSETAQKLSLEYNWKSGGWGLPPQFPQPMTIEFLLLQAQRGDITSLEIAIDLLESMAQGGMYDLIGGGFSRYSTDDKWLIPHFEKMLYDNALLSRVYLHAFLLTKNDHYKRICEETLDFMKGELSRPSSSDPASLNGFYSSMDADSEGEEGKYYLWTFEELHRILNDPKQLNFLRSNYDISEEGNFEGKNIIRRKVRNFHDNESIKTEKDIFSILRNARQNRLRPNLDDKIILSWNGLALVSFSEAARYLDRKDYLQIAQQCADFLLTEFHPKDRLLRSWRNGRASIPGFLEDYSSLILGLISLYQSDPDPYWYNSAIQMMQEMTLHFQDPQGGFYDTRHEITDLIYRPKDLQDNATPSGNSLAATALLLIASYTGQEDLRNWAEKMVKGVQEQILRYPIGYSYWLYAMNIFLNPPSEVVILGDLSFPETQKLIDTLWSEYRPACTSVISDYPPSDNLPPLVYDKFLLNNLPTGFVCKNFVCNQPVNSPDDFAKLLLFSI